MPSSLTVVLVSLLATPAVKFWLLLVILAARVVVLCLEKCLCDTRGYYVDWSRSSLNNTLVTFPKEVQVLPLSFNKNYFFEEKKVISGELSELETFVLNHCKIMTIEAGTFNGLTTLVELSMSGNTMNE
jgi:hypothetical protein